MNQNAVSQIRVSRQQKNLMRSQLEEILRVHQQLDSRISDYQQQTEYPEYNRFWQEMKERNQENIQVVSRYMVMKCNR
ncbi:MAG: hypothetical protein GX176_00630 [Syntrophomonadaceae bacterium]|nr:hypothetical protein [Bacillota bacterium]NLM87273.1 hypothetical protein [Syntrophomonadaceae bacterium]HQA49340.1 hypothetical protein [Syntrophomonadaceae bacterium]HQD89900.1 hypothetical protein [Syntrophomonadaceae bacterium]